MIFLFALIFKSGKVDAQKAEMGYRFKRETYNEYDILAVVGGAGTFRQ
jgi:hypothetical protein